jgi:hypothetical protein
MNGLQLLQSAKLGSAPTIWSIVETGDFNGDAASDIAWRDASGNGDLLHEWRAGRAVRGGRNRAHRLVDPRGRRRLRAPCAAGASNSTCARRLDC